MLVKTLSRTRKGLNAISVIGFAIFGLAWLIYFTLILFNQEKSMVVAYMIMLSGIAVIIALLSILFGLFYKSSASIKEDLVYELMVNTNKEISMLVSEKEIEYAGNYLRCDLNGSVIELDRYQTFKLIQANGMKNLTILIHKSHTRFIEQSPKEIFNLFASMLWAAS